MSGAAVLYSHFRCPPDMLPRRQDLFCILAIVSISFFAVHSSLSLSLPAMERAAAAEIMFTQPLGNGQSSAKNGYGAGRNREYYFLGFSRYGLQIE